MPSEVVLFCLGLKVEAPDSTPRNCRIQGESHALCPKPVPSDSSNVVGTQDFMQGLLIVISLSLESRNVLDSVDTNAILSGLPGFHLLVDLRKPAQSIS